jgi:dolichol-phosphate mannosyltransferase
MISFIIPTLNEINNIDSTVNKIKCLFSINEDYEIIFVDDKSEDGTLQKIQLLSQENDNIKFYIPEKRLGLGNALSIGQKKAKGNFIFFLDCDNSINSDDLISLVNAKDPGTLVIGSRYIKDSKINGVNLLKIL